MGIIRWYHVPETNQVYTGKTAFEPQWPVLEWENIDGVGEITGGRRKYYRGYNRNLHPELDGSHPCGTEDQFRGLGKPPLAGGYVRNEDLCQCTFPGFWWFAEPTLIVQDASVVVDGDPVGLPYFEEAVAGLVVVGSGDGEDVTATAELVAQVYGQVEDVTDITDLVVADLDTPGEVCDLVVEVSDGSGAGEVCGLVVEVSEISSAGEVCGLVVEDQSEVT